MIYFTNFEDYLYNCITLYLGVRVIIERPKLVIYSRFLIVSGSTSRVLLDISHRSKFKTVYISDLTN